MLSVRYVSRLSEGLSKGINLQDYTVCGFAVRGESIDQARSSKETGLIHVSMSGEW